MVRLFNGAICCLGSFNVDLQPLYDRLYNILRFRRELLIVEATFKKQTFGKEASSIEFQAIVDQIDHLQGLSRQVIKDFSDILDWVD